MIPYGKTPARLNTLNNTFRHSGQLITLGPERTKKTTSFAKHLTTAFRPFPSQLTAMEEETTQHELNVPHQMVLPLQNIRIHEVENIIQHKTHSSKAPGYDLITGKILQELSKKSTTSDNANLQCHTPNRIFPMSLEGGTGYNDC
jgi:hypothetical protein